MSPEVAVFGEKALTSLVIARFLSALPDPIYLLIKIVTPGYLV
jgi:hypothetical protein